MTTLRIDPSRHRLIQHQHLRTPPSKSHTLRALVFACMGTGTSHITNFLASPDTESMLHAIELLGAKVEKTPHLLKIQGTGGCLLPAPDVIHAGNSGQVLRFIGALSSLSRHYTVFTGDHSIRSNRPVTPLLEALTQLGATAYATRNNGYAPFVVKGSLEPGTARFGGQDSQPVSAMLIATSFLPGPSYFTIDAPGETPWINLTIQWLQKFGMTIHHENFSSYTIPGGLRYTDFASDISGDFSSAAYPLVASILHNRTVVLEGLDSQDTQGDKQLIPILQSMGANLAWNTSPHSLYVQNSFALQGTNIDVDPLIDALPILTTLGCYAEGSTHLYNARSARYKESDRLATMTRELRKMGANIEEQDASLTIHQTPLSGASLHSHGDHRIAMSLAVAALGARSASSISQCDCIAKSYPSFAKDLQALGFCIEVVA